MELVQLSVPKENVVREKPYMGDDFISLVDWRRDGVGGAQGSSKVQTVEFVETAGAEVCKGMPSKNVRFNVFSVMGRPV